MSTNHTISMAIAGMQIELQSPLSPTELGIDERLSPFFGKHKHPSKHIALEWKKLDEVTFPAGKPVYDPGAVWKMYPAAGGWCAEINYADRNLPKRNDNLPSLLYANLAWDNLVLAEKQVEPGWQSTLAYGAGELLVRTAILLTGGLVLHASGLDDNGSGIVFSGHSGAGKSTQLKIWMDEPGVIALNEDRIAVTINSNGHAVCYGTPWGGGSSGITRNHSAPLKALILLEQAHENSIERLSSPTAATMLACRAFLPYWDKSLMQRAFENLNLILQSTPVYILRCRPEREVIPIVRSVL
ncbi:MAG: hypothetical protein HGA81_06025 [Chlorobium limicola]|nr:hypothetical protein [Chlorobium limicola]